MPYRRLGGFQRHRNGQFAVGAAFISAAGGRDIGIVTPHRGADMALTGHDIVGGIKSHPAQRRQIGLHPGMGGIGGGTVAVSLMIEIAGDIAARDAPASRDRRHDMGEILANAPDRKSTRLNSSHGYISYAVFRFKKN